MESTTYHINILHFKPNDSCSMKWPRFRSMRKMEMVRVKFCVTLFSVYSQRHGWIECTCSKLTFAVLAVIRWTEISVFAFTRVATRRFIGAEGIETTYWCAGPLTLVDVWQWTEMNKSKHRHSGVTWASWNLKSPGTRLFDDTPVISLNNCWTNNSFFNLTTAEPSELCIIGPLWRDFSGDRWIPLTKGE